MWLSLILIGPALAGGVQLPESTAARAWAGVGTETVPAVVAESLLLEAPWLRDLGAATAEERWHGWGAWVAKEAGRELAVPEARAGLLAVAAAENRWEEAWAHFARLGASPAWTAAMMPHLLPGVSLEHAASPGGLCPPLPEGVLLRPALPPALPGDPRGSLRHRVATVEGIRIGEALLNMTITVDPQGVQVDWLHVSGEPVRFLVLLPEAFGRAITIEYIDWMREDLPHQALQVELVPGQEELNLFGRYSRVGEPLPQVPSGDLAVGLKQGGLWFDCDDDENLAAEVLPFTQALSLVFQLPAGLTSSMTPPNVEPWTATVCHLPAGKDGRRKLMALASAAERYALRIE